MRPPSASGAPSAPGGWRRWGAFWLASLAVALLWGGLHAPGRLELALMDHLGGIHARPAPDDVVIVAIDDRSLAALGRWPWRRGVHAQLLQRLAEARPRAVGLDILFIEPDLAHPGDDAALAQAVRALGRVVLPLHMAPLGAASVAADGPVQRLLPPPALAESAAALGHLHIELGPDGVARSVFLREGLAHERWDHWTLAMLRLGGQAPAALPGARRPAPAAAEAGAWQRDHWLQIPFAGSPGHFRRVSYVDVLDGRVPAEALRGRYLLIGATAAGMGDAFLTPMAREDALMPGVEVAANVLDAVRRGTDLRRAAPWQDAFLTVLSVALALWALYALHPRRALAALAALMVAVYAVAALAQRWPGLQLAPLPALACLALLYPLWSWLRLESALRFLAGELQALRRDDQLGIVARGPGHGDTLDRRMQAMDDAVAQLRGLQRFVRDSVESLTDALLATDTQGTVLLANRAAAALLAGDVAASLQGALLPQLLARRLRTPPSWPPQPGDGELVADMQGRELLLRASPRQGRGAPAGEGWIVSLLDVSALQQAQRQREEALRFISHDMRAPQSSILTLLEMHRRRATVDAAGPAPKPGAAGGGDGAGGDAALLARIESHARRTLALADEFVQLARAQSAPVAFEPVSLGEVVLDAADAVWDRATASGVRVEVQVPPHDPGWCLGERETLARALGNLLDNALKYGGAPGAVELRLLPSPSPGGRHEVRVLDRGPGVPQAQAQALFEPFGRQVRHRGEAGVGLGLAFVAAALRRHGGEAGVRARAGGGSEFWLAVPAWQEPAPDGPHAGG